MKIIYVYTNVYKYLLSNITNATNMETNYNMNDNNSGNINKHKNENKKKVNTYENEKDQVNQVRII